MKCVIGINIKNNTGNINSLGLEGSKIDCIKTIKPKKATIKYFVTFEDLILPLDQNSIAMNIPKTSTNKDTQPNSTFFAISKSW